MIKYHEETSNVPWYSRDRHASHTDPSLIIRRDCRSHVQFNKYTQYRKHHASDNLKLTPHAIRSHQMSRKVYISAQFIPSTHLAILHIL